MKIPALIALTLLPISSLAPVTAENQGGSKALDLAGHGTSIAVVSSVPHPDIPTTEPIPSGTHLVENDSGETVFGQQDESQKLDAPQTQGARVGGVSADEGQARGLQADRAQLKEQTPSALSLAANTSQVPPLFDRLSSTPESSSLPSVSLSIPSGSPHSLASSAPISTDDFDWPTSSKTVLRGFDHLEHNWLSGHRGVDIASQPDEKIRAAGPGRVVYAGRVVDNNVVSIEHSTGIRTTYMPVDPSVSAGDWVSTGDVIGTIEEGHCLLGTCLHWGAKRGERYYDPLSLLDAVEIRLYPVSK